MNQSIPLSQLVNKRVVVTGASGYLGTQICRELLRHQATVLALTGKRSLPVNLSDPKLKTSPCNLETDDFWQVVSFSPETVIHLAAQTSHFWANQNPEKDWELNARPVLRLAKAIGKLKEVRIIMASTVTVLGSSQAFSDLVPADESIPCEPNTIYDAHKLLAESYLRSSGVDFTVLRLSNVYGDSATRSGPDRGVIQSWIKKGISGVPLTVFGSGEWHRDYVHVSDVTRAFLLAVVADSDAVRGKVFNVCGGKGITIASAVKTIATRIQAATGKVVAVENIEKQLDEISRRSFVGSFRRFEEATGWKPEIDFESGIESAVKAMLALPC